MGQAQNGSPVRRRGTRLGFWFFRVAIRTLGLAGAYVLLYPVCLYYLLFDRPAFRSSDAYIKRRFRPRGFLYRALGVYRLYISQGKTLVDRYYMAATGTKKAFNIEILGYDRIKKILGEPDQGAILLTSHVGNWQLTMTALGNLGKPVYLMMRPEDNVAVKEALNIDREDESVKILNSTKDFSGVMEAMDALKRGCLVSIMGDRSYGHKTQEVMFLGEKVFLPYGALMLASAAKCPIFVLLSAKVSNSAYILDVSNMIEVGSIGRSTGREGLRVCLQEYANILERYVERYPYQWFVFHDIWDRQTAAQQ